MATMNDDCKAVLAAIADFIVDNHVGGIEASSSLNLDTHATDGTCSIGFTVAPSAKWGIGSKIGKASNHTIGSTVLS